MQVGIDLAVAPAELDAGAYAPPIDTKLDVFTQVPKPLFGSLHPKRWADILHLITLSETVNWNFWTLTISN